MRVITDPTIQGMSGRFPKSRLVMNWREGKVITHARPYVRPNNPTGQADFAEKVLAVISTYKAALEPFVVDLKTYVDEYNQQIVDDHELPVSKYSIFVKACFLAGKALDPEFDMKILTVDNFASGLLDGAAGDVYHLMAAASLPGLGFDPADLAEVIKVIV